MPRDASPKLTRLQVRASWIGWPLLAMLAFSPIFFGANIPLAWGLNAAGFGCLASAYVVLLTALREPMPVPFARMAVMLVPLAGVLGWILLQTQTWVPSGLRHPAWQSAAEALATPLAGTISVNPMETQLGGLRLATAGMAFFLAAQLGRDPAWARRMVVAIAIIPAGWFIAAVVAKAMQSSLYPFPLLSKVVAFEGQLTGPFVNQNHFAIYLGLGLIAAWSLFIEGLGRESVHRGLQPMRAIAARIAHIGGSLVLHSVLFLPLFGGILMTGSRAGLVLTGFAILVVSILVTMQPSVSRTRKRTILVAIAAAGVAGLALLLVHGERVASELAESRHSQDLGPRLTVADIALRAIADRPLLGHGYGTFANVFPSYRDNRIDIAQRWEEAHNSYVEAMLGLGIPVAGLLVLSLVWLAMSCAIGALRRRRGHLAPLAASGGAVLVGLHALIDFSIQIQGVALLFATLLGVGYAQSWSSREPTTTIADRKRPSDEKSRRHHGHPSKRHI